MRQKSSRLQISFFTLLIACSLSLPFALSFVTKVDAVDSRHSVEEGAPFPAPRVSVSESETALRTVTACDDPEGLINRAEQLRNKWERTSIEEAIRNYKAGQICWHGLRKLSEEAQAWGKIGDTYLILSDFTAARDSYAAALILRARLPDRGAEAAARADLAMVLILMWQTDESLREAEKALELSKAERDKPREAQALYTLGMYYYVNGHLERALDYQNKALPLAKETSQAELLAKVLLASGYIHNDLHNVLDALNCYNQALVQWRAVANPWGEARTLSSVGLAHALLGERQKALECLRPTLFSLRRIGDRLSEGAALNNIAYTYQTLGEYDTSLKYYLEALHVFEQARFTLGRILALEYCGDIYVTMGNESAALSSYQQAVALSRESKNRLMEADALTGVASLYLSQGQRERAHLIFQKALAEYQSEHHWRGQSATLNNLGYYYELSGDPTKAREHYNQALSFAQAAQDREGVAATFFNLARVESQSGQLERSREHIEECLSINEASRANVSGSDLRASYLASVHRHYEFLVDVLMRLHRRQPRAGFEILALQASEKARARSLLESLKEAHADIREGIDPTLLERERNLDEKLNAKADHHAQLVAGKQTEEAQVVAREIEALTIDYGEVEAQIRSKSSRFASLTQPQVLSLSEIQPRLLDDNTLLLEYMLGDERSYLWLVTRTEISSYELPGRAEIEKVATGLYRSLIANQQASSESFVRAQILLQTAHGQLTAELGALSKLLLAPIADKLKTKRLLIVADGALQYIPFQALAVSVAASSAEPRPLILDHEIIYEPSASTLALVLNESENRKPASGSVAILADPVFEVDDSRLKSANPSALVAAQQSPPGEITRAFRDVGVEGNEIPRLLSSRAEAEAIMAVVPWRTGFKAVDFDANRFTAMGSDLGQYRVVHFATHALLNNDHPELSGIVLSLVDQKGQRQDGFLRLHDIYNLKLPVDLVVLSACQTGLGKDVKGEGLIGLTRGFMYAGASGVVASLWKVDDEATAELMKHFYAGMFEQGLSPSAALREAQLALRQQKRWQEPYFWAGFVIQGQYAGNGRNSYQPTPAVKVAVLGFAALGLSLSVILVLWRRRRRNL